MKLLLLVTTALFFEGNSDFFDTADAQVRQGAKWVPLDKCREADPNLPSLVIQPGNGESIVCYKLEK